MPVDLEPIVARLAKRTRSTEDDIQSDIRTILLDGGLNLSDEDLTTVTLEAQAGGGRRIDIEVGYCVIEVKKDDIWRSAQRARWIEQLAGYMQQRSSTSDQRYIGILTDGVSWVLYHLVDTERIAEVARFDLIPDAPDAHALSLWLEGVLATGQNVAPTPLEIHRRLGSGTPTHELEHAELQVLWSKSCEKPSIQLKRELWGNLLTVALGSKFEDNDDLFVRHTYLVILAELIAHAAIGFPIVAQGTNMASLLAGHQFTTRNIKGVVEPDFFDWVIEAPDGEKFVRGIARRIARFDWSNVDHDVLKVLYESVIETDLRHKLGEYYTPDWLAEAMVNKSVTNPLAQTVLDPGCGSGTFLFYAVRKYLAEADMSGVSVTESVLGATRSIFGIDVHPVAVTLARVTYLLALGSERLKLRDANAVLTIPVYLGDSVQWRRDETLLSHGTLEVPVPDEGTMFASHLVFPKRLLEDPNRFDAFISEIADKASDRDRGSPVPSLTNIYSRYALNVDEQQVVYGTFSEMCRLHDRDRNHIWGYYIRHATRPYWLSQRENQVDVLVGNPPWLAKRFMSQDMQVRFKKLAVDRGLWLGGAHAPQQDLAALFVARCAELYLKPEGSFGFVMPRAVLESESYAAFRSGLFSTKRTSTAVTYDKPWDLRDVRSKPAFFPMPACVVFGRLMKSSGAEIEKVRNVALGDEVDRWSGELPQGNLDLPDALKFLSVTDAKVTRRGGEDQSPYATRFFNGATLFPRLLIFVEPDVTEDPIGFGIGVQAVRSSRSRQEHEPWKSLPSLTGSVEDGFLHHVYTGAVLLPFRLLPPLSAVLPWKEKGLMESRSESIAHFPHLQAWWTAAEDVWNENRSSDKMTLNENIDYHRKLSNQFPIAPERVAYTMAGTRLAAARLSDERGIVEQSLVWMNAQNPTEAKYIVALFNSRTFNERVSKFQTVGQFGRRHFTKHVFNVPFPMFDPTNDLHIALASASEFAENVAENVDLPADVNFGSGRRLIRRALDEEGSSNQIDLLVTELLKHL